MEKFIILLPFVLIVVGLILGKYVKKILNENTYSLLKIVSLVLVVIVVISTMLFIFFKPVSKSVYGWNVDFMKYDTLHKYSTGKSQKIALIDSGISDFQFESNKKNSIVLTGDSYDHNGHGTMMYSLIKGYNNQVLGIAPDVEVLSIKILDSDEKLKSDLLYDGIKLAIDQKCTIINLSLGSYIDNRKISDLIDSAIKNGIVFVTSSGDYGDKDMLFPANKSNVISVGSLSAKDHISKFTNAPSDCVILAPGDDIKTVNNKKVVAQTSGTSEASVIISGYIALLKDYASQKGLNLTNEEIKNTLISINKNKKSYTKALSEVSKK